MSKAIAKWTGGIRNRVEAALRADGVLFRRCQEKTFRGYRFGKWKEVGKIDVANIPSTIEAGFSTLREPSVYTDFNPRLPN